VSCRARRAALILIKPRAGRGTAGLIECRPPSIRRVWRGRRSY